MNIVYLGTPEFAVAPLKAIIETGKDKVVAVVTNKDKPVGRKKILTPPPVKVYAKSLGIKVLQYDKIRLEGVEDLKSLNADLMVTCAFGQILSREILDLAKLGVFNIHASLLPKYRGASPIHYAILNGEKETGITVMKTDEGIDTGDIVLAEKLPIENQNCGQLFSQLSILGGKCIVKALDLIREGKITFTKQDNQKATYTKIIKKEDAFLDFNDSAVNLINKIRAYNPSPVAYTLLKGQPLKIFSAEIRQDILQLKKGQVALINGCLLVGTATCAVELVQVQKAGGKCIYAKEFIKGNALPNFFPDGE